MSRGRSSVILGPVHRTQTTPDNVNKILSKLMIGDPLESAVKLMIGHSLEATTRTLRWNCFIGLKKALRHEPPFDSASYQIYLSLILTIYQRTYSSLKAGDRKAANHELHSSDAWLRFIPYSFRNLGLEPMTYPTFQPSTIWCLNISVWALFS